MPLTKDEASDLQSAIDRLLETSVEQKMAELRRADAKRVLDNVLHGLSHPKPLTATATAP